MYDMERWVGKIAVVTGASAGVGAAVTLQLVNQGLTVVGVARRVEKIEQLQEKVTEGAGKLIAMKGDMSKIDEIKRIFSEIKCKFGSVHVLVNNAGFMVASSILDGEPSDWQKTLDLNVLGVATCAKEAINLMRETGVDDGHIININSTLGHRLLPSPVQLVNVYPSSKYAVTALSQVLRLELKCIGSRIRVTNLSPGYIKSDFMQVAANGCNEREEALDKYFSKAPPLEPEDLAYTINFILSTPAHVQVQELIIAGI